MSSYTKAVNFAAKDSLPSGNASKVVSGTELNTEFSNIESAVNSKANTASPTFTGTAVLPTVDINAGAIDGTTIGASSASTGVFTTITGTTITASTGFVGALTGDVTGNITGTAPAGTLTGATLASNVLASSLTSLGTIASLVATTADINGGTIDGATIGATTPAAGTFTTFTSTGIDDNATGEILQIGDTLTSITTDTVVGGATAGAASAATLYATGNITGETITARAGLDVTGDITLDFGNYIGGDSGNRLYFDASYGATVMGAGDTGFIIDSNNNSTTAKFVWAKDATDIGSATEIMRLTESAGLGLSVGDLVVGGTTAGAASSATLYADGSGKFSTGSSGATANTAADQLVVEGTGNVGMSFLADSAGTFNLAFGDSANPLEGRLRYDLTAQEMNLYATGANQLTLSGASGSELATFAGDITILNGKKAILGSGGELQIFRDATNAYFRNSTGANYYDGPKHIWRNASPYAEAMRLDSGNLLVGGNSAGAASAVTLYATGAAKFSIGASGATPSTAADDLILEKGSAVGASILGSDSGDVQWYLGSTSLNNGGVFRWNYNASTLTVGTNKTGASTVLKGDAFVDNITASGASGSELLTAEGSVSVTDFLRIPDSEVTISGGVVTATGSRHTVDTEGGASSDDLATINGGTEGDILILNPENSARTVVLKDGTGNLLLSGDFSMDSSHDTIMLIYTNSNWREISRSNNA